MSLRRWIGVNHPRWADAWYWPWHAVQHRWRGKHNTYLSGFFCQWCAGERLHKWRTEQDESA